MKRISIVARFVLPAAAMLALASSPLPAHEQGRRAPTYTVLYAFSGTDGANPFGVLTRKKKHLYGTTSAGGSSGWGTAFKLSQTGTETVLYSFTAGTDGASPLAGLIRDAAGNLYGTAAQAGVHGAGVVFELSGRGAENTLYSFAGPPSDGSYPYGALLLDESGNLYGTTEFGGSTACDIYNCGTVFKLSATGAELWLHNFTGGSDGAHPVGGLISDTAGNLYGTSLWGGGGTCVDYRRHKVGCGTVFKVDSNGTEAILYAFTGGGDGAGPSGALVRDGGNLYGTTESGGASGAGTIFKLSPKNTKTVLYNFTGGTDGGIPESGVIRDSAGNLYGTTSGGGDSACTAFGVSGCGTVFKLGTDGTETILYTFTGGSDGAVPYAGLLRDSSGNLYGTTDIGGNLASCDGVGCGTVFEVTP